ncbi:MAG: PLP-dependent aminotransferase family protein [Chryseobacterium sp.]|jgi:DNA-binding transcriptional MocR family regulator|uniref:aminotransferase-like domain-containing protein n=1 Tax=Chryseobacterium sp. TaxID=1871047 RepID=UPI00281F9C01|nr:PLP-dependent aminotransferase family protein [Chryseobacterium sp.]MDR2236868.1 PLP-dependent aminotransferase family protein [Chryseobacterium sp.]
MKAYKYEVFTSLIEAQIRSRILVKGQKLPSIRDIKNKYSLSTSSVQNGFEYLMIHGLVESRPRSGYFVAYAPENNSIQRKTHLIPVVRDPGFARNVMFTSAISKNSESGSFNTAAPGDLLVPQKLILRTMQEVIREKGAALLRYYPSDGLPELKKQIAVDSGLNPDQIIITDGALQAMTIALSTVTIPGDIVAVESPCVFSVLEVLAGLGLKIMEVPVHYENGFDTEFLKKICDEHNIRAVVVTPNFHNPTGIVMSDEAKKELTAIAFTYNIPVIENDIYGDLYFSGKRPATISCFDDSGLVMTVSSFSKTLAPGIRLGWLYAGRFYSQAERSRFVLGRSVSPVYQELMLKLLQKGRYERHLRPFRNQLKRQAIEVLAALYRYFPEDSYFHSPLGGYSIWGRLPEEVDAEAFFEYCGKNGIWFAPGSTFSLTDTYRQHFRIIFADRITTESFILLEKAGKKSKELLSR